MSAHIRLFSDLWKGAHLSTFEAFDRSTPSFRCHELRDSSLLQLISGTSDLLLFEIGGVACGRHKPAQDLFLVWVIFYQSFREGNRPPAFFSDEQALRVEAAQWQMYGLIQK